MGVLWIGISFWPKPGKSSDESSKNYGLRAPLKSGDYELSVDFELNVREQKKRLTHQDLHMTSVDLKTLMGVKRYTLDDKIAVTMKEKVEDARHTVINRQILQKKKYNTHEIK